MKKFIAFALCACLFLTACIEKKDAATLIMVHEAKSFATLPSQKVGAAIMVLHNPSTQGNALIKASSDVSARVELHNMVIDEKGVMRMREVSDIPIKAGEHFALTPDGYHLMLMDLKAPLVEGTEIPITLEFKNGEILNTKIPVLSRAELQKTLNNDDAHAHH